MSDHTDESEPPAARSFDTLVNYTSMIIPENIS